MTDSYQAIYDAVRSRISNGDIGRAVSEVARQAFDISYVLPRALQEIYAVSYEMRRPSAIYRPALYPDGNKWCALYGTDLQEGVAGFGDSPEEAMAEFDKAWAESLAPMAAP